MKIQYQDRDFDKFFKIVDLTDSRGISKTEMKNMFTMMAKRQRLKDPTKYDIIVNDQENHVYKNEGDQDDNIVIRVKAK